MRLAALPTDLGMRMIGDLIQTRLRNEQHVKEAVCAFQRMALADGELPECITAMEYWFKPEHKKWAKVEEDKLQLCKDIVKKDVLGIAMEALMQIATKDTGPAKERLQAATVLNEIYGDNTVTAEGTLSERLVVQIGEK